MLGFELDDLFKGFFRGIGVAGIEACPAEAVPCGGEFGIEFYGLFEFGGGLVQLARLPKLPAFL